MEDRRLDKILTAVVVVIAVIFIATMLVLAVVAP